MTYHEVKASYLKTLDNGTQKRVTEAYLVDAESCTEAEAIATKLLAACQELSVTAVKQCKIAEIFGNRDSERFYLAKIAFITLDERTAQEKRTVAQMLVGAADFKTAVNTTFESMNTTMADFEVVSLAESPIVEILQK
jgi:hypothetical protein